MTAVSIASLRGLLIQAALLQEEYKYTSTSAAQATKSEPTHLVSLQTTRTHLARTVRVAQHGRLLGSNGSSCNGLVADLVDGADILMMQTVFVIRGSCASR